MSDTSGGFEVDGRDPACASENCRLREGKLLFSSQLFLSAALKQVIVNGCCS